MKYEDLIKISDPYKVYTKIKKIYPCDSHIAISTRNNKKYMIHVPHLDKYIHFGSTMEDYTKHEDKKRRLNFLRRNAKWADADIYSAAYASFTLLW